MHHNVYIMYIDKNVCDDIVNTLLAIDGKPRITLIHDITLKHSILERIFNLLILMMMKFIFLRHLTQ